MLVSGSLLGKKGSSSGIGIGRQVRRFESQALQLAKEPSETLEKAVEDKSCAKNCPHCIKARV